jgi:hypothetical protein
VRESKSTVHDHLPILGLGLACLASPMSHPLLPSLGQVDLPHRTYGDRARASCLACPSTFSIVVKQSSVSAAESMVGRACASCLACPSTFSIVVMQSSLSAAESMVGRARASCLACPSTFRVWQHRYGGKHGMSNT